MRPPASANSLKPKIVGSRCFKLRSASFFTWKIISESAKQNGDSVSGLLRRSKTLSTTNEQQVHVKCGELAGEFGQAIEIAVRPSDFEDNIFSLDPAQFTQSVLECLIGREFRRKICK